MGECRAQGRCWVVRIVGEGVEVGGTERLKRGGRGFVGRGRDLGVVY